MTADQIWLYAATLNASGTSGGGEILVGGDEHGGGTLAHADTVTINGYTTLDADATENGNGGNVVIWSDATTIFGGNLSRRGGSDSGNGGSIEISSAGVDYVGGSADASAPNGISGMVLLDPHNITISSDPSGGGLDYFQLTDPDPSSSNGGFGSKITTLSNGNILVVNSSDSAIASNSGAVYLFNGGTGALISTLTGSNPNDYAGFGDITALPNGNYVVVTAYWNNSAAP